MDVNQQTTFSGLPIIGADAVIPRGTKPGTFRLRLPHDQDLDLQPGTLTISSDETVTFGKVVPDLSTVRVETTVDGRREWVLLARDRRQTWKGKTVSGRYNARLRDNSIEPGTEKTAAELADLALEAAGEFPVSDAPNTKPTVEWESTPVPDALNGLSSVLPVHVCRLSNDTFNVRETGSGASLPVGAWNVIPTFKAKIDGGPKTIKARCGETWFQCGLELEAVGMEASGAYVPIAELSYKPSLTGWGPEWPTLFSGVTPFNRGFAFLSVYRVYRIKTPQELPFGFTLYDLKDIDLDPHCVVFGQIHQPPAVVLGTFWPYSDHYKNTENCPLHSSDFTIDREQRAVVFDYPVWKAGSCVDPADLKLYTGFHLRDPATGDWRREAPEVTRATGEGEQVIDLPFLWRARSYYAGANCATGTEHDNDSTFQAEAAAYLNAWKDHWDTSRNKEFMWYAGTHKIDLSGNIAEITYRLNRGLAPYTRASEHFQHSLART